MVLAAATMMGTTTGKIWWKVYGIGARMKTIKFRERKNTYMIGIERERMNYRQNTQNWKSRGKDGERIACTMHAHVACVSNYKFPFCYFIAFSWWNIHTQRIAHTFSSGRVGDGVRACSTNTIQNRNFCNSHMCVQCSTICTAWLPAYWDIANLVLIH